MIEFSSLTKKISYSAKKKGRMSVSHLKQLEEACNFYFNRSKAACEESVYSLIQKPAQACWNCNANLTLDKIKKCSRCHLAIYCGQNCQRRDWAVHKQPEGCTSFSEKFGRLKKLYSVPDERLATAKDLSENGKKIEAELSRTQKALSDCLETFSKAAEVVRGLEDLLKNLAAVKDASISLGSSRAALINADFEQASLQLDNYKQHMSEMQKRIEMYTKTVEKLKADWSYNQQMLRDLHSSDE